MRLQHRTPGGTLGERSLCWEQIWAGWWWMVDGCKNRTCGLKMDKCGSEHNWPALSAWTKHTGRFFAYFCLRTFSLYADYEIRCMEMLTQSTIGHLHIYTSFGPELWYVLTMVLGQLARRILAPFWKTATVLQSVARLLPTPWPRD